LSPQSEIEDVRHFLRESNFRVVDEEMMIEDGKYYNIIKAIYLGNATDDEEADTNILYDRYGKLLIQKKSPVLLRYAEERIEKLEGIYCRLSKETGDSIIDRMAEINSEVDELAKVIELIKN
jgi:tRNA (adenine22-N1)-methyltransferase